MRDLRSPAGLDNLLYSADTYFSCFADLALTSPVEYFKEGTGSLMQVRMAGAGARPERSGAGVVVLEPHGKDAGCGE